MIDHHQLIHVLRIARLPGRNGFRWFRIGCLAKMLGGAMGANQGFQRGNCLPGGSRRASRCRRLRPRRINQRCRLPIHAGDDPAALVVRRRDDRNGLAVMSTPYCRQVGIDVRETFLDELGRLAGDVKQNMVRPAFLHLGVDGAGHDVARGQRFERMIFVHEGKPSLFFSTPPSPRTASLIRKDLALGWKRQVG